MKFCVHSTKGSAEFMSIDKKLEFNISWTITWRRALKIFLISLIYVFFSIIFVQVTFVDNYIIKSLVNSAIFIVFLTILYSEGVKNGESDSAFSEIMDSKRKNGMTVLKSESVKCFNTKRSFFEAYFAFWLFVIISIALSIFTKENYFESLVKPGWLKAYNKTEQFLLLSLFDYGHKFALLDFVRLITRLILFPFFNLFSNENIHAVFILEKLSPLIMLTLPLSYVFGYTKGPKKRREIKDTILKGNQRKHKK